MQSIRCKEFMMIDNAYRVIYVHCNIVKYDRYSKTSVLLLQFLSFLQYVSDYKMILLKQTSCFHIYKYSLYTEEKYFIEKLEQAN